MQDPQPVLLLGLNHDRNFTKKFFHCSWNICTCFLSSKTYAVSASSALLVCKENEKQLCEGEKLLYVAKQLWTQNCEISFGKL